jgi:hypothetical protein
MGGSIDHLSLQYSSMKEFGVRVILSDECTRPTSISTFHSKCIYPHCAAYCRGSAWPRYNLAPSTMHPFRPTFELLIWVGSCARSFMLYYFGVGADSTLVPFAQLSGNS